MHRKMYNSGGLLHDKTITHVFGVVYNKKYTLPEVVSHELVSSLQLAFSQREAFLRFKSLLESINIRECEETIIVLFICRMEFNWTKVTQLVEKWPSTVHTQNNKNAF